MTAIEFCQKMDEEEGESWSNDYEELPKRIAEFTRMHVIAALEEASKKAITMNDPYSYTGNTGSEYLPDIIVGKNSILNSYDLNKI